MVTIVVAVNLGPMKSSAMDSLAGEVGTNLVTKSAYYPIGPTY